MTIGAKIGAGFAVGMGIIVAIGVSAYVSTQRLLEANRQETHSREVVKDIEHVMRMLDDAETGQRGFLLTGADRYLDPYDAATGQIHHDIDLLADLTRDNAAEQEDLRQLQKLADAKLAELQETIQLQRQSRHQAAVTVVLTDRGKKIMDDLRDVVKDMKDREDKLLDEENAAADASANRTRWAISVWMPIALLVLGVAAVVLMRTVRFGAAAAPRSAPGKKWGGIAIHYAFAVIAVAVAVVLRWRLGESFGAMPLFVTFYPAVLLVVSIGGGGPGILATVLAALAADYWFIPPYHSFRVDAPNDLLALGIFTAANLCLCILAERFRRAQWAEAISVAQERQLDVLSRLNEELSQQSEELSQQSEELTQQNEELQTQSEEIQTLNTELQHREDMLQKLLDATRLATAEQAVMQDICAAAKEMFGPAASAVMVLEQQGDRMVVRGQAGLGPEGAKVESWPAANCIVELVIAENKTAALADATLRLDLTLVHPPGEQRYLAALAAPMRSEGRPFGAVGIYSRQKQEWTAEQFRLAEWLAAQSARILETLRLQEQLHGLYAEQQTIFNSVPAMIWYKDTKNSFVRVNRAVAFAVGKPLDAIEGKSAYEVFPDQAEHYYQDDLEVINSGQPKLGIVEEMGVASGEKRWVQTDKIPYRGEGGDITGVLVLTVDITDRKRAEEALRASEERLAGIIGSAMDAIVSVDAAQRIVLFNAAAEKMFRCAAAEAIGQSLDRFIPERLRAVHASHVRAFGEEGTTGRAMDRLGALSALRADGQELPIEASISQIAVDGQKLFTVIVRDITQRKEAENALQRIADDLARSNKDLEQFAYVASHDLKEPLRMVTGFMSLLKDRCQGKLDAKSDEYIAFAADGASRMQRLIDDLLAYSRAGRGEIAERTDVGAVLDRVLGSLTVSIKESGAVITHDPLPTIASNPVELTQLFQNLIGNAIKFKAERRPEIHVGARRQAGGWQFTVRDNGIGIDPQFADRIFMIFQRLHTREKYAGTGIGLAICKKIVERHGGRIWVESQPAAGSTFCFTIPDQGKEQG